MKGAHLTCAILLTTTLTASPGCARSHARDERDASFDLFMDGDLGVEAGANDAGEADDAGLLDEGVMDLGPPDLGMPDLGPPDLGPPTTPELRGNFTALVGARDMRVSGEDTANTWLVAGDLNPMNGATLIRPSFERGDVDFVRTLSLPGTGGFSPVAAARDREQIAVVFMRNAALPVLMLIDGAANTIVARHELDFLVVGIPQYVDIVLRDEHISLTAELFAPETHLIVRTLQRTGSDFVDIASYDLDAMFSAAMTPDAAGAGAVISAVTLDHVLLSYHVTDTELIALETVSDNASQPAWDGTTLAYRYFDSWRVGGFSLSPSPTVMQYNGDTSLARTPDGAFSFAFAADSGDIYFARSFSTTGPVDWFRVPEGSSTDVSFRYPAIAYADELHHGVFYIETALGVSSLPVIRYNGAEEMIFTD